MDEDIGTKIDEAEDKMEIVDDDIEATLHHLQNLDLERAQNAKTLEKLQKRRAHLKKKLDELENSV